MNFNGVKLLTLIASFTCAISAVVFFAPDKAAGSVTTTVQVYIASKIVAEVNGERITGEKLERRMEKIVLAYEQQGTSFEGDSGRVMLRAIKRQVLSEMINQVLILQAVKKEGLYPAEDEVKKRFDEIKANFGDAEKFEDAMRMYGYTEEELLEMLTYDLAYAKLFDKVTAGIKVNDDRVKEAAFNDYVSNLRAEAKIKNRIHKILAAR